MEYGMMCTFDTCVYDWYVLGVECDACIYYVPFKLINDSKIRIEEDEI